MNSPVQGPVYRGRGPPQFYDKDFTTITRSRGYRDERPSLDHRHSPTVSLSAGHLVEKVVKRVRRVV